MFLGVALVAFALTSVDLFPLDAKFTPRVFQIAIAKLVVFSLGSYATAAALAAFRAESHNAIVDNHRANALTTFEAFVNAPHIDQDTKNAILTQTTTAIFAQQPSGYGQAAEASPIAANVLEIVKQLPKSGS